MITKEVLLFGSVEAVSVNACSAPGRQVLTVKTDFCRVISAREALQIPSLGRSITSDDILYFTPVANLSLTHFLIEGTIKLEDGDVRLLFAPDDYHVSSSVGGTLVRFKSVIDRTRMRERIIELCDVLDDIIIYCPSRLLDKVQGIDDFPVPMSPYQTLAMDSFGHQLFTLARHPAFKSVLDTIIDFYPEY